MQDLNKATLTGFVTDPAEVKFKPRKGKSFLVVRSDRFSGTPDDIIVEIPNRLKGTFREWNWIKVSGRIRSKWVRADHQEKKYMYLEAYDVSTEGTLLVNTVEMTANICKKPVLRKTPLGKTICEVCVAINGYKRSEYIKNEGVEGDSIEEILKARRRDLRKAKSDVDDIAKQIRKEQGRQVECDETLPAQRDDLLDLLKENEKQEKALCDASREYDRISIELAGLKRSRDALVEKAGKTAREKHDRITSLLYTLKSDKKNAENKLRLAEMDLEHANKGIERHKAALAQAKKKYTEALKEKWDGDTELTAIRGEEFDPALAICPTCGQTLPEEQVETAKRKFEFNKQSRISKKLGEKEQFEKNKRTKLEQIAEDGKSFCQRTNGQCTKTTGTMFRRL